MSSDIYLAMFIGYLSMDEVWQTHIILACVLLLFLHSKHIASNSRGIF